MPDTPPLTRRHHSPPPGHPFLGDLTLAGGRCHEFCGPSRRTLALMLMARRSGPVIWLRPSWATETLHAPGVLGFADPGRILLVTPSRGEDVLWAMEESLRSGAAPLVVAECDEVPGLTPVRRLHLAAQTGGQVAAAGAGLIGVLLTPGDGGAPGIESRWSATPRHCGDARSWLLERRRARMAPPAAWVLHWN
ncbi:MAG: hypothetical protein AAF631_10885, partial [Pseudomonadota bacterium]